MAEVTLCPECARPIFNPVVRYFSKYAPAVVSIVAQALIRIARRALGHPALIAPAVAAFLALTVFDAPFPLVVLGADAAGLILSRWFATLGTRPAADGPEPIIGDGTLHRARPRLRTSAATLLGGATLWLAPLIALALLGLRQCLHRPGHLLLRRCPGQLRRCLRRPVLRRPASGHRVSLADPSRDGQRPRSGRDHPGPLIMVMQFVAFLGAYRAPGPLEPWVAGVLTSLLVTWITFVPCFVLVFLGAPYLERLRGNRTITAALTGITAAVVGVVADISVYFAEHTLFHATTTLNWGPVHLDIPDCGTPNLTAITITALAALLIFWRSWSPLRTAGLCAGIGLIIGIVTLVSRPPTESATASGSRAATGCMPAPPPSRRTYHSGV